MPSKPDNPSATRRVRFGPFEADFCSHQLRKFGVPIRIQEAPLRILEMLLDQPGTLVSREDLLRRLWSSTDALSHEHHLNAAVWKLRSALGDLAEYPRYVQTVPRGGYQYVGPPVERVEQAVPEPPVVQETVEPAEEASGEASAVEAQDNLIRFREFTIDIDRNLLLRQGTTQALRPQALRVLTLLARRQGELVSREEFRREVWGDSTFVDFEQGLNHCIAQIRRVLGDDHMESRYIQTVPGRGYCLLADALNEDTDDATPGKFPGSVLHHLMQYRYWVAVGLVATGAVVLLVASFFIGPGAGDVGPAGVPSIRSIAVLPLDNLSDDPEQEFFADGMTEELVTTLGKVAALRVISRTSVMRYKRTTKPIPEIARELDVDAIIEGTVQQLDGKVRVTTNLLHGPTDRHLWAERYEEDLGDVLLMQRDIARDVARQVRATLSPEDQVRLAKSRSLNPEAHDLYLKGQFHYYKWRAPEFHKAISYFERAIEVDPDFAQAHLGLAKTYGWLWIVGAIPPEEAFPRFTKALERASQIDDSLPETHYVKAVAAWFFYWNWPQAESEFRRALALNPNLEEARFEYGWFLSMMGRWNEAVREAERAVASDPLSVSANLTLGSVYTTTGQSDKALAQFKRAMELEPNDPRVYEFLSGTYHTLGLYDEVVRTRRRQMLLTGKSEADIAAMEAAYRSGGHRGFLLWELEHAKHPFAKARFLAALGRADEAMENLELCYKQRWWAMVRLNSGGEWDALRGDPRFQELLQRMKFPPRR